MTLRPVVVMFVFGFFFAAVGGTEPIDSLSAESVARTFVAERSTEHVVVGHTELLHNEVAWSRGAETIDADHGSRVANDISPAQSYSGLHCETWHPRRQYSPSVVVRLFGKELPGRH